MEHETMLPKRIDTIVIEFDRETNQILYLNTCIETEPEENDDLSLLEKETTVSTGHLGSPASIRDFLLNPGETIVKEYTDNETGRTYECWTSLIRWYDSRLVRLEMVFDSTSRKKAELQLQQICLLKERLLDERILVEKLQDVNDTALKIFNAGFVGIWLYESLEEKPLWETRVSDAPEKNVEINTETVYLVNKATSHKDIAKDLPEKISFHLSLKTKEEREFSLNAQKGDHSLLLSRIVRPWAIQSKMDEYVIFPMRNVLGRIIGYMGFFRDIIIANDEMMTMKNLVHSTSQLIGADLASREYMKIMDKYRVLVENLPQGVYLKDPSFRYHSCNTQFALDIGRECFEIIGKTDYDLFPASLAEKFNEQDTTILSFKETKSDIFEFVHNGKARWIESVKTPLFDDNGIFSGVLGIMHDISAIKLSEEELICLYNELEVRVAARTEELCRIQEAYHNANSKLNLLNSVTRHDIIEPDHCIVWIPRVD